MSDTSFFGERVQPTITEFLTVEHGSKDITLTMFCTKRIVLTAPAAQRLADDLVRRAKLLELSPK